MPTFGFAFPILPGKDVLVREIGGYLRDHRAEHEQSRGRLGTRVERAYLQRNPDGSMLVAAYVDADRGLAEGLRSYVESDAPLDRYFVDKNSEATGIDFRTAPSGPEPELVGQWVDPDARGRGRGFAFAAPLQPGKAEAARQFAREAYAVRREELARSRREKGISREEVFLNQSPHGDLCVVYLEGTDPVEGNRQFAASNSSYDRWFKEQCRQIFPPFVDFDQPVPANEEIFSWVRA